MVENKNNLLPEIAGCEQAAETADIYSKGEKTSPAKLAIAQIKPLAEVEKEIIVQALYACDGNIIKAPAQLEIAPSTLYRKLKRWKTD